MFDEDQTSCETYYNGFMLAGPKYPVIGVGDFVFKNGEGCNQCLQLEYNGKVTVGMAADWHPTLEPQQLDVSPLLAQELGFPSNDNPDPKAIKVTYVSCGVQPRLNLGGKLRFIFGPGSKDTSLEMNILGGFHPIKAVNAVINGATFVGKREGGKFRFGGFVLKANSIIQFQVAFDDGSSVIENISVATIVSGLGGGGNFFKSGSVTTDKVGDDKVNPAVLTWVDFVDGTVPLPLQ